MKTINKKQIFIISILFYIVGGCTDDFDEMNIDPNQPTADVVPASNAFGDALEGSANVLLGERINIYYAGSYAGFHAHRNIGDYEYRVGINNSQFRSMYRSMYGFVDAMRLAEEEDNDNLYAAALTMKAYMGHKTSDIWGSVPYSEAFSLEDEEISNPKYDSQPELYDQFLDELEAAAEMFDADNGDLGEGDFLYEGDVNKWKKFCNSIRLRVAIRMSSVDEGTASSVISEILDNPGQYPVLENNADNAYLWWPGESPYFEPWYQRLGVAPGERKTDNYRVNHTLVSNLLDLNDPRLPVYADENAEGEYNGYRFGPDQYADPMNSDPLVSHIGDRHSQDPGGFSPFMNCAEVYFIKAEAYERGLASGDAQEAYEKGITASLEENEIDAADIDEYLEQSDVAWDEGNTSNLDKIYLQKWFSLYKQSVEAWAENRRTDVPVIDDIAADYAGDHNRPPFRFPYPEEENALNDNFPTEIAAKQEDIFYGIQLWWDTRPNVY